MRRTCGWFCLFFKFKTLGPPVVDLALEGMCWSWAPPVSLGFFFFVPLRKHFRMFYGVSLTLLIFEPTHLYCPEFQTCLHNGKYSWAHFSLVCFPSGSVTLSTSIPVVYLSAAYSLHYMYKAGRWKKSALKESWILHSWFPPISFLIPVVLLLLIPSV